MLISFVSFMVFLTSILVVTSSSPITSVVYLIGTFILVAMYLSSQGIYYIALTYIVVYVGAVITLFLFVVIIINLGASSFNSSLTQNRASLFTQTLPLIIIIIMIYTILMVSSNSDIFINSYFSTILPNLFQYFVSYDAISKVAEGAPLAHDVSEFSKSLKSFVTDQNTVSRWNQIQSIGFELYTHQAMYLVLVSIILIVSMIGPIVICGSSSSRDRDLHLMFIIYKTMLSEWMSNLEFFFF